MGRQVQILGTREDFLVIAHEIAARGGMLIEPRAEAPRVASARSLWDGRAHGQSLAARREDFSLVVLAQVPGRPGWYVDQMRSPVLEISGLVHTADRTLPGRLYCGTGAFDHAGIWRAHPEEFLRWAGGLMRWVRTQFRRDRQAGAYVGPRFADERSASG